MREYVKLFFVTAENIFLKKAFHFLGLLDGLHIERSKTLPTKKPNRNTKMKITIAPAAAALTKYTHATPESAAKDLADRITELEAQGYTVTSAISSRSSVPNTYKSAYKMCAPFYVYSGTSRQITLVSGKLENRPRGAAIPAHIFIQGSATPAGYRALSKSNNIVDLIPA